MPPRYSIILGRIGGILGGCFICTTVTGTSGKLLAVDHLAEAIPVVDGESMTVLPKMLLS